MDEEVNEEVNEVMHASDSDGGLVMVGEGERGRNLPFQNPGDPRS